MEFQTLCLLFMAGGLVTALLVGAIAVWLYQKRESSKDLIMRVNGEWVVIKSDGKLRYLNDGESRGSDL